MWVPILSRSFAKGWEPCRSKSFCKTRILTTLQKHGESKKSEVMDRFEICLDACSDDLYADAHQDER